MVDDESPTRRADPDDQPTLPGLGTGQVIFGRYRLESIAGRGGMGVVWRARDEQLERVVALKFLPDVVAGDPEAVRDLKRETQRCLELTHPHIVRVHDFVQDERQAAIAMEFVDGDSLAQRKAATAAGGLSTAELSPLVAQLCAALDYAHGEAKVVHRDLKPANLLVTKEGRLKVSDFGIARSLSDTHTRLTGRGGNTSGTLAYMSPQQLTGANPSAGDDIYALGATLYDLLGGKPPFNSGDISFQIREVVPPPLNQRRATLGLPLVPGMWEATIAACLAKEPRDRPRSAGEVAARLGLVGAGVQRPEGGSPNAPTRGRPGVATSPSRKSKAALIAGLAAAVVVLAGLGYYFGVYQPGQQRLAAERTQAIEAKRLADEKRLEDEKRAADERARQMLAQKQAADEHARREASAWVSGLPLTASEADIAAVGARIDRYAQTAPAGDVAGVRAAYEQQRAAIQTERERLRIAQEKAAHPWTGIDTALKQGKALLAIPFIRQSPTVEALTGKLDDLQPVIRRLSEKYLEGHPKMVAATDEYRALLASRDEEALRVAEQQRADYGVRFNHGVAPDWIAPAPVRTDAFLTGLEKQRSTSVAVPEATAAVRPVAGQPWAVPQLGLVMQPIPGGTFTMGSPPGEAGRSEFEGPQVQATISQPFWLGRTEVTQAQWEAVMGTDPSRFKGNDLPVEQVSWDDALAFCLKLTERERAAGRLPEGYAYTLPTEAQWEYACRAGTTGPYAGDGSLDDLGWYDANSGGQTHPTGQRRPNAWGLYDMHGNVWEWCADWYGKYPGGSVTDYRGAPSGATRVCRGGSFLYVAQGSRSASRNGYEPDFRFSGLGFRLALAPSP